MKISLESARVNAKLSIAQVAEKTGKTAKTISNWEHGITPIPTQYFFYLCELYGIKSDYVDVPIVRDGFFYEDTTE